MPRGRAACRDRPEPSDDAPGARFLPCRHHPAGTGGRQAVKFPFWAQIPVDLQHPAHAQAPGPALVRLVARLAGAQAPPPPDALAARLGGWIGWPQAVALASALDVPRGRASPDVAATDDGTDDCLALRSSLLRIIERDRAFAADPAGDPGAAFYRQRYTALQQVMGADVDLLRRRLRHQLGQHGAALARLAAVDAALEQAVGERERSLLSMLPACVAAHFERLRADDATTAHAPSTAPRAWLALFQRDMKQLLVAELDVRLQPARGLLGALRTRPDPHAP